MTKSRRVTGRSLLAVYLRNNNISQVALAQRLDVSEGTLSRWLSGERKPSREKANLLEKQLAIPAASWDRTARAVKAEAA